MKSKWAVLTTQTRFDIFFLLFFLSQLQMLGSVSIQLGFCSGETCIEGLYCSRQIRHPTGVEDGQNLT